MITKMKTKLRSQEGASITFALLLFLVCAVLCSVLLTAATIASGRMSNTAELDQRYYSVTSAAELVKDMIDGETVSVVEVKTETGTVTYGSNGSRTESMDGTAETKVYLVEKSANEINPATDLVNENILSESSANTILKNIAYNQNNSTGINRSITLSSDFSSAAGYDYDAMGVTIQEVLDNKGNLKLELFNTYRSKGVSSSEGSRYKVVLSFGVEESETKKEEEKEGTPTPGSDGSYTVPIERKTTTVSMMTWNLIDMKTGA